MRLVPPSFSIHRYGPVVLTSVWCCSESSGSRSCGRRADWPPASPEDRPSSDTPHSSLSQAGRSSTHREHRLTHSNTNGVCRCLGSFPVRTHFGSLGLGGVSLIGGDRSTRSRACWDHMTRMRKKIAMRFLNSRWSRLHVKYKQSSWPLQTVMYS